MDYEIHPLVGAGPFKFGMTSSEVKQIAHHSLGASDPMTIGGRQYFSSIGLFALYNEDNRLEALEFASPAAPTLGGFRLIGVGFEAATANLRSLGGDLEDDPAGTTSHNLGVSLYAPGKKEDPLEPRESVLAFASGYYDAA